jgi:hypothetical protein
MKTPEEIAEIRALDFNGHSADDMLAAILWAEIRAETMKQMVDLIKGEGDGPQGTPIQFEDEETKQLWNEGQNRLAEKCKQVLIDNYGPEWEKEFGK